jgi:predicted RND superfamily exporter protein
MKAWIDRVLERWVAFSLHRTRTILLAAVLFLAISAAFASRLGLRSDLIELLPTDSPSVINLEALKKRTSSFSTLTVAIQGKDLDASMRFADDLVARLKQFPPEQIRFIDYSVNELKDFYSSNKFLYADLADLERFRDRLSKRIKEETEDSVFESLDDTPKPKTDLGIDDIREKYEKKAKDQEKYPKGYYVNPDRDLLAVMIRPPSGASSYENNLKLVSDVRRVVDELDPKKYSPQMEVGFTGDIQTGLEEREALASDMQFITILCLTLILAVIVWYYRSFRALLLLGTPMLLGLAASLAITYFAIGYLNTATAFLSSIIAGNGINFMIIMAARFFEEIRKEGHEDLDSALRQSVLSTAHSTLIAAAGAAIAYGSLSIAGFRGFRQFGLIGGVGMLLCWFATFAVGPALIAFLHRRSPLGTRKTSEGKHRISRFVAWVVTHHPRKILVGSLIVSSLAFLTILRWSFDPFEYDFRNLRNRVSKERGSAKLSNRVDQIFSLPSDPTPVVVDRLDRVQAVREAILSAPDAPFIIGDVKTLYQFLPTDQEAKLKVLADLRRLIDGKIDFLPKKDRDLLEEYRPPESLKVLDLEDIPEAVARPFTEADGTRGRVLYVYRHKKESLLNGRYLLKFSSFLRGIEVPDTQMIATGQPMIFADMITAVLHDGVRVTALSFFGLLAMLLIVYRGRRESLAVMMSVVVGTGWMLGFAALFDLKLNFLNFVVIPIGLGISVDYGANILNRYRLEGPGRMETVMRSTGGAVFLCALTTIIGYATLITSTNMALQTFGVMADLGEICCIFTAEVTMTALIVWMDRRRESLG